MVKDTYETVRKAYREFYRQNSIHTLTEEWKSPILALMDDWAEQNPDAGPMRQKRQLYGLIAEHFDPIVFPESPLFWATGDISFAEEDGMYRQNAGAWVGWHGGKIQEAPPEAQAHYRCARYGIHLGGIIDIYHHAAPFTNILARGLVGFHAEAEAELAQCGEGADREFLKTAISGLLAWKRMAERFAEKAELMAATESEPSHRENLLLLARTARHVPWNPPETFVEAFSAVVFIRHTLSFLDGLGQHVYGLLDRLLRPYYENDLREGRITREKAVDLLAQGFLIPDCSPDEEITSWEDTFNRGERACSVFIGGRDATGKEVCNDLTMMILDLHHDLKLHFPKLCARVTKDSPQDYLRTIARDYLSGRNVMAIMNDDAVIPAQLKAGKRYADVVNYVNSACWEIVVEGCEHSAGANNYLNLLRLLDLSINRNPRIEADTQYEFVPLDGAADFEEVYRRCSRTAVAAAVRIAKATGSDFGRQLSERNPHPLFSACLKDCLKNHRDYTAGGARYNPHGIPLLGFANVIDSLLVIRTLCFERKTHSLEELLTAVRADWDGCEALRAETNSCPFFGDGGEISGALSQRLFEDLSHAVQSLTNERGGPYQLGFYSSWEFMLWGKMTGPTPDGRKAGEVMANGISPSRRHTRIGLTDIFRIPQQMDLSDAAANASLDITLPLGNLNAGILENTIRSFAAGGGMQLQMNCISKTLLEEAMRCPEEHRDIFVRIYGLSVRFVTLSREWQDEILSRSTF